MKIAFTANGTDWKAEIDPRFGRTVYIVIYDDTSRELTHVDNRSVEDVAHGAGPQTAQKLFDLGPDVLITGNGPGGNAATVLQKAGLKIFVGAGGMTLEAALEAYKKGALAEFAGA